MELKEFVRESNRIEGILREPTTEEVSALHAFVDLERPTVYDLVNFVKIYQPDARLRDAIHVPGVRVGGHIAPMSGPEIREQLQYILDQAYMAWSDRMFAHPSAIINTPSPWQTHVDYETLHPFTDGNGRSGRALWLWCMGARAPLGFLHTFYYQTLSEQR